LHSPATMTTNPATNHHENKPLRAGFTTSNLQHSAAQRLSSTRRAWQHPLAPLLSMPTPNFNLNPAINAGSR
jgi:hypothetical protein